MIRGFLLTAVLAIFLNACGEAVPSQPVTTAIASLTASTPVPSSTAETPAPTHILETKIPALTSTPGPVTDGQGNVTWHPQEVLIASEQGGGDGVSFDYPPKIVLLWNGTLLQPGRSYSDPPFVSHLDQDDVCRILNTIDDAGFFEEPRYYNFPFDGLGSEYVSVNAWKSQSSGAQLLDYAISGAPYYDGLFCRNCPLPSEQTIIRPGLANVYFFLNDYVPQNREAAPLDKLGVYFVPTDKKPTRD